MITTQYTTLAGDRWDTIANKAYGDPFNMNGIIQANPLLAIVDVFIGGVVVLIPVLETTVDVDVKLLPIWKQVPAQTTLEATAAAPLFVQIAAANANGSFDPGSFD